MATSFDAEYFQSYGSLNVHELMIKDKPRTEAYKEFIEQNVHLIKNKVVLDVGAGSGILSLFAARAGAKKVYAVEASDVSGLCEEIVAKNKYDHVIKVVRGRIEDVDLLEKVDVIISEWMGFYLLHESMLDSVLFARDKWLKKDGILLPSHASIYTCPVNMSGFCQDNFECWKDVYGFDFTPFQERTVAAHLKQPTVLCLKEGQLLAERQELAKFELKTMKISEVQELEEKMSFRINKCSVLHGFAAWFEVHFTPDILQKDNACSSHESMEEKKTLNGKNTTNSCSNGDNEIIASHVTLDTSPLAEPTHWKQTVCFLPVSISVEEDESIYCKISLGQDGTNKRHYNISLEMLENLDDSDEDYSDEDDFEEDTSRHPIPCDCGSGRCRIIGAIMEKYDEEQNELEMEAEFVDVSAEVQAAQSLDNDSVYLETENLHTDDSSVKYD